MLRAVSRDGYSWSSSTSGSSSYFLDFHYNWINPNNLNCHSYGFPLRCLQE
ncbi:MAG: hypothetical protein K2K83_06185 [Rikenella sp.]|nr:hypothetical protein [Rikenella sp.]